LEDKQENGGWLMAESVNVSGSYVFVKDERISITDEILIHRKNILSLPSGHCFLYSPYPPTTT
jgi:hypothetical protein